MKNVRLCAFLVALALTLCASAPAQAQMAVFFGQNYSPSTTPTVTEIGTGTNVGASGSHNITIAAGVPSGVGLVIAVYSSAGNIISSCADGSLNSYTIDVNAAQSSTGISFCSGAIAVAIASSGNVTVGTNSGAEIHIFKVSPFRQSSTWLDTSGTAGANTTSSVTATTSGSVSTNDIVFGGCTIGGSTDTAAITSGYTSLKSNEVNFSRSFTLGWKEVASGSGTQSAVCTLTGGNSLNTIVAAVAYKEQ